MKEPKMFSIGTWSISIWILQEIWLDFLRGAGRKGAWIWRGALIAGWRRKSSLWRCSKRWLINKEEVQKKFEKTTAPNLNDSSKLYPQKHPKTNMEPKNRCFVDFVLKGLFIFRCQPLIFRKGRSEKQPGNSAVKLRLPRLPSGCNIKSSIESLRNSWNPTWHSTTSGFKRKTQHRNLTTRRYQKKFSIHVRYRNDFVEKSTNTLLPHFRRSQIWYHDIIQGAASVEQLATLLGLRKVLW